MILRVVGVILFLFGAVGSIFAAFPCNVVAGLAIAGGGLYMVGHQL